MRYDHSDRESLRQVLTGIRSGSRARRRRAGRPRDSRAAPSGRRTPTAGSRYCRWWASPLVPVDGRVPARQVAEVERVGSRAAAGRTSRNIVRRIRISMPPGLSTTRAQRPGTAVLSLPHAKRHTLVAPACQRTRSRRRRARPRSTSSTCSAPAARVVAHGLGLRSDRRPASRERRSPRRRSVA